MTAAAVQKDLKAMATLERTVGAARFFKTGLGQYGEGDVFLGVTVPDQRKLAKQFKNLPLGEVVKLLQSPFHECRATALFILVLQYQRGTPAEQQAIYDCYLANTARINNWDLVDCSAGHIVGQHLGDNFKPTLVQLAHSSNLWERRIAMIACFYTIMQGNPEPAFNIIDILEQDSHDLIQKAVGWMLREIGKRCDQEILTTWLLSENRYQRLPRTTLRYAIEHYPPDQRKQFLTGSA